MAIRSALLTSVDDPDRPAGYPFRGPGTLARVAPFACIAALAEASLALSPNLSSPWAVAVSIVLLLAVGASFRLPWQRLPDWPQVLVPLAYSGSVLALTLAAGTTSGVGIVGLVPLVWTALFQRRWQSACVLVAVVTVEIIVSVTPVADPASVIVRRVILWAGLGVVTAYATHELRERDYRSRREATRLQAQVTELTVARDRDRIAADLQDKVIRQVFAAGFSLQSTATLATDPEVRKRILASAENLDEVLRLTREAVFGLEQRPRGRGLRAEVVALCSGITPVPEVSFTGLADDALDPARTAQLTQALREALSVIRDHSKPERVVIATGGTTCTAEIETDGQYPDSGPVPEWHALLQDSVSDTDITFTAKPLGEGTRFTWSIPRLPLTVSPPTSQRPSTSAGTRSTTTDGNRAPSASSRPSLTGPLTSTTSSTRSTASRAEPRRLGVRIAIVSGMDQVAEPADQPITRTVVSDVRLPAVKPTDRVQVREIRILPSQPAGLHVHNGPVFGSVVSGSAVYQIEGQPASVLRPGDVFYEPEGARIARFDAQDDGVTFLAYFLLSPGQEPELTTLSE